MARIPYAGIMVIASGSVDCATTKNVIRTLVVLTMDGSFVESSERTCHNAATCPTYMILNDPEPARCESDPML